MNRFILSIFLFLGLWACNDRPKDNSIDQTMELDNEIVNSKYNTINLQINNPTIIDSSDWVIYPLTLEELEETDKGFKSSSYGRQHAYWNIAFYNTETKQSRLLTDSFKLFITSINPKNDAISHSGQRNKINAGLIYYSITTTDYNHDGKVNFDDPKYLFISDFSGQNFKQVSPSNLDLDHWQTINKTRKILIQARRDNNKDKKFNSDDEIISFIYDIENKRIEQVFKDEFSLKAKKLLDNQWVKKK